jgi:hypothetical protein
MAKLLPPSWARHAVTPVRDTLYLVFIDESGCGNIAKEPFLVYSAVAFPASSYGEMVVGLRQQLAEIESKSDTQYTQRNPPGLGYEIKAIDAFKKTRGPKAKIRELLLKEPAARGGRAILTVQDRKAFAEKHPRTDANKKSREYLIERIARFLRDQNSYGVCIIDNDEGRQKAVQKECADLIRDGNIVQWISRWDGLHRETTNDLDRIVEVHFGDSEHSVGLIIADYFAHGAFKRYALRSAGKREPGWWIHLKGSLRSLGMPGCLIAGYGLKYFPGSEPDWKTPEMPSIRKVSKKKATKKKAMSWTPIFGPPATRQQEIY